MKRWLGVDHLSWLYLILILLMVILGAYMLMQSRWNDQTQYLTQVIMTEVSNGFNAAVDQTVGQTSSVHQVLLTREGDECVFRVWRLMGYETWDKDFHHEVIVNGELVFDAAYETPTYTALHIKGTGRALDIADLIRSANYQGVKRGQFTNYECLGSEAQSWKLVDSFQS